MRRLVFAVSVFALLVSCATLDERFNTAIDKRQWAEAGSLAESAEESKRGDYLYEYAKRNFTLSLDQKIEAYAKAGTVAARKELESFAYDAARKDDTARCEKILAMAGKSQAEIDYVVGKVMSDQADRELAKLYGGADVVPPEVRSRFESFKAAALDRYARSGKRDAYLSAVATLYGGDRRFDEGRAYFEKAGLDKTALSLGLSNLYGAGARYLLNDARKRYETVANDIAARKRKAERAASAPVDMSKDQAEAMNILKKGLDEASSYALESFAYALASGNADRINHAADAVIETSLDGNLTGPVDLAPAKRIAEHYLKAGAERRLFSIAKAAAGAGAYGQAVEWFAAAGKPKAESFMLVAEAAEKRKEPRAVAAGFIIRAGDRQKIASEAETLSKRAQDLWRRQYAEQGSLRDEYRAGAIELADAASLYAAAVGDTASLERCVDVSYYTADGDQRVSGYYKAFGYEDAKITATLAHLHEKKFDYVKAIDIYEKMGDLTGMERVADTILKEHLEKYRFNYGTIKLNTELWKAAFSSGSRTDVFKKKIEESMTNLRIFCSTWQRDLAKAVATFRTLGKLPKAFDALDALAEVGGLEEARALKAQLFAEDRTLEGRFEKASGNPTPERVLESAGYQPGKN